MKLFHWLMLLLLILPVSLAYYNCTPAACSGSTYGDVGVTCEGSECQRGCVRETCGSWEEVYSDTCSINVSDNHDDCQTGYYQPSDSSKCFRFDYLPPENNANTIVMSVPAGGTDCDSVIAGGFWQTTGTNGVSSPWFQAMSDYWGGSYGSAHIEDFLIAAHTGTTESSTSSYRSAAATNRSIYCTPNSGNCTLYGGTNSCDTDCYNLPTKLNVDQGSFIKVADFDDTIQGHTLCTRSGTYADVYAPLTFKAYSATMTQTYSNQTCERGNEAPLAYNVSVTPEVPTMGTDLLCRFDYIDPEGFEEQNSSYRWYRNNTNMNISEESVGKGNLSITDIWRCEVAASDGLNTSTTYVASVNNVTILSTVKHPAMYVETQKIWNQSGYYSNTEWIYNFSEQLESSLDTCTADAEGYCTITLNFSSDTAGSINISALEIVYEVPVTITNHSIVPSNASAGDNLTCVFEYVGNANGNSTYNWWKDGTLVTSGTIGSQQNLTMNTSGSMGGDIVSCEITPSSGTQTSPAQNASIVLRGPGLKVQSFVELASSGGQKIVRTLLNNTGTTNLTNINWTLNWGEGTIRSAQQLINLTVNETVHIVVANAYSSSLIGTYTANISASTGNLFPSALLNLTYNGDINISLIATQHSQSALIFKINNTATATREIVNWTIQWGDGVVTNSTQGINLSASESLLLAAAHTYTNIGVFSIVLTVNGVYNFTTTIITGRLSIENFTAFNSSTMGFARFRINNTGFQPLYNIQNWSVHWGDGARTNGTQPFNLSVNESIIIVAAHNYTSGTYEVRSLVNHSAIREEKAQNLTV